MNAKHTPGPWKEADYIIWPANHGDAQYPVHARKRGRIAVALTKPADARLIAAAPDLLAAAQTVLADLNARIEAARGGPIPVFRGIAALHDAIHKATGTTHD